MVFDSVRDPLANLAPLGDPIPVGGPDFHRIVINLPRFQCPGDGGQVNVLTHRAIPSPFNVRSFWSLTMGRSLGTS
jgi:hypothetical protein